MDKTKLNLVFILLLSSCLLSMLNCKQFSSNGHSLTFYVAKSGSDDNNGSKEAPFKSLQYALEAIKEQRNNSSRAVLIIREGEYYFNNTVYLDSLHSNLEIKSAPGEKATFTGGISLPIAKIKNTGTKDRNHYWEIDLKPYVDNNFGKIRNVGFARPYGPAWGELFVNKTPYYLARWPNEEMIPIGRIIDQGSIPRKGDYSNRGGIIAYDSSRVNSWVEEKNPWMAGYFMWGYADDMVKIAAIDTLKKTIKTASATLYGFGSGKEYRRWHGVNILSELDFPGEYYIDNDSGMLHFVSDTLSINSLEFSILETPFLALSGLNNIRIQGINFVCSRGLGIAMDNTENVTIENCVFQNLGSIGVTIGKGIKPFSDYQHTGLGEPVSGEVGSLLQHFYADMTFHREGGKNNKIINCTFRQLGAGGISLGGGNRISLEAGNNVVENCLFYDLNRIEKSYRPAIHLTGVGNVIKHCEIYNTPSMAIYIYGNDHLIEYNYLHDVCLEVEDQGAIYYGRDPTELGTVVRYNYFANIPDHYRTCAIYHDDGSGGMTVTGNIFYRAGHWASLIGGGSHNIYNNNIFIDTKQGIHIDNRMQGWAAPFLAEGGIFEQRLELVNYQYPPYSERYPWISRYFENEPARPNNNIVENNVFVSIDRIIDGNPDWLDFRSNNLELDIDPGFVDWESQNFTLRNNSIIYQKLPDFRKSQFNKIGIRRNGI